MALFTDSEVNFKSAIVNCFLSPCAAQVPDDEQFVPDFQSDNREYLLNIHVARKLGRL